MSHRYNHPQQQQGGRFFAPSRHGDDRRQASGHTAPPALGGAGGRDGGHLHHHHQNNRGGGGDSDDGETFTMLDTATKSVVTVHASDLFQTNAVYSGQESRDRPRMRCCEAFHLGKCRNGNTCPDFHVRPDLVNEHREATMAWMATKEDEFMAVAQKDPSFTFRVFCADMKEVIEVPAHALAFSRGLFLSPEEREKRVRGNATTSANQAPTACGLYSQHPAQCKWRSWCNQAHVDPMWMAKRRIEFDLKAMDLQKRFNSLPEAHDFIIHDPEARDNMLVPKRCVAEFTRGLFQGTAAKAPSVCILFQRRRGAAVGLCTAGPKCNQVHVDRDWLVAHRNAMASVTGSTVAGGGSGGNSVNSLRSLATPPTVPSKFSLERTVDAIDLGPSTITPPSSVVPGKFLNPNAKPFDAHLNPKARPFEPPQYAQSPAKGGSTASTDSPPTKPQPAALTVDDDCGVFMSDVSRPYESPNVQGAIGPAKVSPPPNLLHGFFDDDNALRAITTPPKHGRAGRDLDVNTTGSTTSSPTHKKLSSMDEAAWDAAMSAWSTHFEVTAGTAPSFDTAMKHSMMLRASPSDLRQNVSLDSLLDHMDTTLADKFRDESS